MVAITFDTLGYFEKLTSAGVPEAQAKVQVDAMQDIVRSYDEASRKELVTKGDLQLEIEKVRAEIHNVKHEILKWVIGIAVGQTALIIAVLALMRQA